MGQRKRRRFTDEFKKEAARLCLQHDRSIGQVAQELDLTESALRNWVKQYEIHRIGLHRSSCIGACRSTTTSPSSTRAI